MKMRKNFFARCQLLVERTLVISGNTGNGVLDWAEPGGWAKLFLRLSLLSHCDKYQCSIYCTQTFSGVGLYLNSNGLLLIIYDWFLLCGIERGRLVHKLERNRAWGAIFSMPEYCFVAKQLNKTFFCRDTLKYGTWCQKLLTYALRAEKNGWKCAESRLHTLSHSGMYFRPWSSLQLMINQGPSIYYVI